MSTQRDLLIQNLMWKEVAQNGVAASYTFIVMGIMMFYYHFGIAESSTLIRSFCVLVFMGNALRLWVTNLIGREGTVSSKNKNILRVSIWINTVAWSGIFTLGSIGLNTSSYHLAILVTMVSGFVAASIVTLSYDRSIFYPFQILILGPLAIYAVYQWKTGQNPQAIYFAFCCLMFYIYQAKQVRTYRTYMIQRFNYQLDLEKSLIEVKDAQEALVNQTTSLIHASKISGLGEMAGGLSHEVNNSLQVILGSSQQIQREFKKSGFTNSSIESKIDQSIAATMKIKTVVDGLQYFSQEMETGPKQVVPLKQVVDQALKYTQELLKAHHVGLTISHIPDVSINCHPFQITQVIFNLIKNADDAVRSVEADKWIDIKFEETKDSVLMMVINSGPIIAPEIQNRLFQPFFSTKDVNLGTGLSLSISRGIALDHKGDLFYKSGEKFTTFVLKLPKAE